MFTFFFLILELQLFSYPSIGTVGGNMSGVISPTNLSLFSSPVTVNTNPQRRHMTHNQQRCWNSPQNSTPVSTGQPFITLDEEYMMTPLIAATANPDDGNGSLMDQGIIKVFFFFFF